MLFPASTVTEEPAPACTFNKIMEGVKKRSYCPDIKFIYGPVEHCMEWVCSQGHDAFSYNIAKSKCKVVDCGGGDPMLGDTDRPHDVYVKA